MVPTTAGVNAGGDVDRWEVLEMPMVAATGEAICGGDGAVGAGGGVGGRKYQTTEVGGFDGLRQRY